MKKQTRKYSLAEKAKYHKNRLQSPKATENQKVYSRNWLDGFNDEHVNDNFQAIKKELNQRKVYVLAKESEIADIRSELRTVKSVNKTVYGGYINGAKARLNQK